MSVHRPSADPSPDGVVIVRAPREAWRRAGFFVAPDGAAPWLSLTCWPDEAPRVLAALRCGGSSLGLML